MLIKSEEIYWIEGARTIGIDFDGTICPVSFKDYTCPKNHPPLQSMIDGLNKLVQAGFRILVHTGRINERWNDNINNDKKIIQEYMDYWHLSYHEIWTGRGKPYCRYYIDDSAIQYKNNMTDIVNKIISK